MKAIIIEKYGTPDVLKVKDVPKPTPEDNEVLVKIHATSVTYSKLLLIRGKPLVTRLFGFGLLNPKQERFGSDIAGCVVAVGKNATQFKPGDEVFGDLSDSLKGGFSEYICAPEADLLLKPANSTFEEATAVPESGLVAYQALHDKGNIQAGQKVLICGASGGIGTFAVQIAKQAGAEVTAVCSPRNFELVRSLGADHVIDYTKEDFAQNGQQYDLILATVGHRSIRDYKRALSPTGTYVATGGSLTQIFQAHVLGPLISLRSNQTLCAMEVIPNKDLGLMKDLIEAGKIKSVIDRCYPLHETAEAFRYYGKGRAQGKVIVTMG